MATVTGYDGVRQFAVAYFWLSGGMVARGPDVSNDISVSSLV